MRWVGFSLSMFIGLAWAAIGIAGCAHPNDAHPLPNGPISDKQSLIDAIRASRSSVQDLTVVTTNTIVEGAESGFLTHSRMTWIFKGQKIYRDGSIGNDLSDPSLRRVVAYDGQKTVLLLSDGQAMITAGRMSETTPDDDDFFNINMLSTVPHHSANLLDKLQSPQAQLRDQKETIDGHVCCVVDVVMPGFSHPTESIWLDQQRGYLPIRRIDYSQAEGDAKQAAPRTQYDVEQAVRVCDGLWLATRGSRRDFPPSGGKLLKNEVVVESTASGLSLKVNSNVSDDVFDLARHLPAGTHLWDSCTHHTWTIGIDALPAESRPVPATQTSLGTLVDPRTPDDEREHR